MALVFTLTPRPADGSSPLSRVVDSLATERSIQTLDLKFPPLDPSARVHLWVLQAFRELADAIDTAGGPGGAEQLRRAVAIVGVTQVDHLDKLDPLSTTGDPYGAVVALLILTFPEIHWIFTGLRGTQTDFAEAHVMGTDATAERVMRAYDLGFVPLFDPTGLREQVRKRVRDAEERGGRVASYVPERGALAVAIDEEQDYAFLNAYVAYRFGYRCHALTSYENAVRVLRTQVKQLFDDAGEVYEREARISTGHYLKALVARHMGTVGALCPGADVASFLRSPDFMLVSCLWSSPSREEIEKWLLEEARARAGTDQEEVGLLDVAAVLLEQYGFPVKDRNLWPVSGPEITLTLEDRYLNFADKDPDLNPRLSDSDERNKVFGKLKEAPHRFFVTTGHERGVPPSSLWSKIKIRLQALRQKNVSSGTVYKPWSGIFDIWDQLKLRGPATGFVWPPVDIPDGKPTVGSHSAHGRLLVVAERLIARAQLMLEGARSVPDAVHGALLALEAKEYLGHRTPTTSLEALALQHQLEVLAECSFYGVEYNMNVASRFADIERELAIISEWFLPAKRKLSRLNAELRIVSELLLIFRAHSQFDEEQRALVKLRDLHRGLWLLRHRRWAWVIWPLRAYIEVMLRSLGWLVMAFVLWIGTLSLLYVISGHGGDPYWVNRYWHAFADTIISFVGLSPPHDFDTMWRSPGALRVCMVAISLGFLHLGIFITHLYALLARR